MSKKKKLLVQTGETLDGAPVFGGVFAFHETYGLPLEVIFQNFIDRGYLVDWIDFYQAAINAGMKHDRILSRLEEAISDSFGKEYCQVVISRLDNLFRSQEKL